MGTIASSLDAGTQTGPEMPVSKIYYTLVPSTCMEGDIAKIEGSVFGCTSRFLN